MMGTGSGAVARVDASSSNQVIYIEHLFTANYIEKRKVKKKRPGMAY